MSSRAMPDTSTPVASMVSFIIPTKNSDRTVEACLDSIRRQKYQHIEIVVVDNYSTDRTREIATRLADKCIEAGPERSAQRNIGAQAAKGEYVVFIDSDMVLGDKIAQEVAEQFESDGKLEALVLPEAVQGNTFWVRCRSVEKELYLDDPNVEAARAFRRATFDEVGGYDERLTGPEDWDLPDRVIAAGGKLGRVHSVVMHDEDDLSIYRAFKKKIYYGRSIANFLVARPARNSKRVVRTRAVRRAGFHFFRDPLHTTGMVILKGAEFSGIAIGMATARRPKNKNAMDVVSLSETSVFIAAHELFEGGTAHALERYLAPMVRSLDVLLFPFGRAPEPRIGHRRYVNGKRQARRERLQLTGLVQHQALTLVRDAAVLFTELLRGGRKIDVFFGIDPFNCAIALVCRKWRLLNGKVVLYSIDFSPKRYENPLLNRMYHAIDEFCARKADIVWNVSPGIEEGRSSYRGSGKRAPHVVVPVGVDYFVDEPQNHIRPRLVFLGHLIEKQGLQYVLRALPELTQEYPGVELVVVGMGAYEEELRRIAATANVTERVRFCGYVKDDKEAFDILAEGGIAMAPYTKDPDSFTRFADPGKLKVYLAAALPIILSNVPGNAEQLEAAGCATIVEPNSFSVAMGVRSLLSSEDRFKSASKAALDQGLKGQWTQIFDRAVDQTAFFDRKGGSRG